MSWRAVVACVCSILSACGGDNRTAGSEPVEPTPTGCVQDTSAGPHTDIPCDGLTYVLTVPDACVYGDCGLIADVHGGTMNAALEDANTKLSALGEAHGYIVVQPNAAFGLFNAGVDDDRVYAFMQDVIATFHVDTARVHITGFSQGGFMTWRFICTHADFLASAAPAAAADLAAVLTPLERACTFVGADVPSRPIPILYLAGTRDALVNYTKSMVPGAPAGSTELQRDAVIAHFGFSAPTLITGDDQYRWHRYTNGKGAWFEMIDHDYSTQGAIVIPLVGHCYPGSEQQQPNANISIAGFGCTPPNAFVWGEAAMQFFIDHPRAP